MVKQVPNSLQFYYGLKAINLKSVRKATPKRFSYNRVNYWKKKVLYNVHWGDWGGKRHSLYSYFTQYLITLVLLALCEIDPSQSLEQYQKKLHTFSLT